MSPTASTEAAAAAVVTAAAMVVVAAAVVVAALAAASPAVPVYFEVLATSIAGEIVRWAAEEEKEVEEE